jgi:hypothetical protein
MGFVRFHFCEYRKAIDDFVAERAESVDETFEMMLPGMPIYPEFRERCDHATAHVVALMHSLHALSDTIAHVVYFSLAFDQRAGTRVEPHRVEWKHVRSHVRWTKLGKELDALVKHPDYYFLSDAVNYGKHRSVIATPFTLQFRKANPVAEVRGLQFEAFEYKGREHAERWVSSTLKAETQRQVECIVRIGQELNLALARLEPGLTLFSDASATPEPASDAGPG